MLNPRTQKKVTILGEDYNEQLDALVPLESRPPQYGGTGQQDPPLTGDPAVLSWLPGV